MKHIEAEEKAVWLWERQGLEQWILFAIIPFERRVHSKRRVRSSTNCCRTCDDWALASETVQGGDSKSRNSYCSGDSRKTDSKHMYGSGGGGGTLEEPQKWKHEDKQARSRSRTGTQKLVLPAACLATRVLPRTANHWAIATFNEGTSGVCEQVSEKQVR